MIDFRVPPTWRRDESVIATLLLRPARDVGSFRTNVVIGVDRAPVDLTLERRLQLVQRHLETTRAELEVVGEQRFERAGHRGVAQLVAFDAPTADERVAQLHVLIRRCARTDDVATEFCELVATTDFDELERHAWAFSEIVRSIEFG